MQPPALARLWDDPDTGLGLRFPFDGGRKRGCGFGHKERSEVRGKIAEVSGQIAGITLVFTSAI
jgi:hypothetical protein